MKNRNSMIISPGPAYVYHHVCYGGCDSDPEGLIPRFYSKQHAKDCGWCFVEGPSVFLPNDGWICPDCLKRKGYYYESVSNTLRREPDFYDKPKKISQKKD